MNQESIALTQFLFENNVKEQDDLFLYDHDLNKQVLDGRPWLKDPLYFQEVKISAKALIIMSSHARSGGDIEVMGIMIGKIINRTMVIIDCFPLPVEGTETRVNAQAEGNEYMIEYLDRIKEVGRLENAIGWYHSHPGYGCWLSGIDVTTQSLNQQFQEPFLAVVIDPIRSASAGKVEIGAFRTYPQGYTPTLQDERDGLSIPMDKAEDFGIHSKSYYPIPVSFFTSSTDKLVISKLWAKYWATTLSQSQLFSNISYLKSQFKDLESKAFNLDTRSNISIMNSNAYQFFNKDIKKKRDNNNKEDEEEVEDEEIKEFNTPLTKLSKNSGKVSNNANHLVMSELLKLYLFS